MPDCLIAFGSNVGDRQAVFQRAIEKLDNTVGIYNVETSKPVQTVPVGGPKKQDSYLNAAIRIQSTLDPFELHRCLIEIENQLGRFRRERWGSRTIDLDLLLYDQQQIETAELQVPHPRMSFRRFVLEPACEVARDMIHPPSGQTLGQLVSRLDQPKNLILVVCQNGVEKQLGSIIQDVQSAKSGLDVDIRMVRHLDQLRELTALAKLVVYPNDKGPLVEFPADQFSLEELDLFSAAASFPGPTLELPGDPAEAKLELSAAIAAMSSLPPDSLPENKFGRKTAD